MATATTTKRVGEREGRMIDENKRKGLTQIRSRNCPQQEKG